jgi:hypothetical protein
MVRIFRRAAVPEQKGRKEEGKYKREVQKKRHDRS